MQITKQEQDFELSNNKKYQVKAICDSKNYANQMADKLLSLNYLIF